MQPFLGDHVGGTARGEESIRQEERMCQGLPPILMLFIDFKISRVAKKEAEAHCELPHVAAAVDCRVTVDRRRSEYLERLEEHLVLVRWLSSEQISPANQGFTPPPDSGLKINQAVCLPASCSDQLQVVNCWAESSADGWQWSRSMSARFVIRQPAS